MDVDRGRVVHAVNRNAVVVVDPGRVHGSWITVSNIVQVLRCCRSHRTYMQTRPARISAHKIPKIIN